MASLRSRYSSRKTFTCSRHGCVARYSRTMSWARLEWQSTADSAASTSRSRIPGGAATQPTRRPGAMVLENVPRYTTPRESSARMARSGSPSNPSSPYGLSSINGNPSRWQMLSTRARRAASSVTPAGLWNDGTV